MADVTRYYPNDSEIHQQQEGQDLQAHQPEAIVFRPERAQIEGSQPQTNDHGGALINVGEQCTAQEGSGSRHGFVDNSSGKPRSVDLAPGKSAWRTPGSCRS